MGFVTDSEWDDPTIIVRAKYNRRLQVYPDRLDRWEDDDVWDLRDSMAGQVCRKTELHHAG